MTFGDPVAELKVVGSPNLYLEDLHNSRTLETLHYVTDLAQTADVQWTRDSGLQVHVGISAVNLVAEYEDVAHHSDNTYMLNSPNNSVDKARFRHIINNHCRWGAHSYYSLHPTDYWLVQTKHAFVSRKVQDSQVYLRPLDNYTIVSCFVKSAHGRVCHDCGFAFCVHPVHIVFTLCQHRSHSIHTQFILCSYSVHALVILGCHSQTSDPRLLPDHVGDLSWPHHRGAVGRVRWGVIAPVSRRVPRRRHLPLPHPQRALRQPGRPSPSCRPLVSPTRRRVTVGRTRQKTETISFTTDRFRMFWNERDKIRIFVTTLK